MTRHGTEARHHGGDLTDGVERAREGVDGAIRLRPRPASEDASGGRGHGDPMPLRCSVSWGARNRRAHEHRQRRCTQLQLGVRSDQRVPADGAVSGVIYASTGREHLHGDVAGCVESLGVHHEIETVFDTSCTGHRNRQP